MLSTRRLRSVQAWVALVLAATLLAPLSVASAIEPSEAPLWRHDSAHPGWYKFSFTISDADSRVAVKAIRTGSGSPTFTGYMLWRDGTLIGSALGVSSCRSGDGVSIRSESQDAVVEFKDAGCVLGDGQTELTLSSLRPALYDLLWISAWKGSFSNSVTMYGTPEVGLSAVDTDSTVHLLVDKELGGTLNAEIQEGDVSSQWVALSKQQIRIDRGLFGWFGGTNGPIGRVLAYGGSSGSYSVGEQFLLTGEKPGTYTFVSNVAHIGPRPCCRHYLLLADAPMD